jgi:glycosyltransferase involved in cell wall biosynthesis
MTTRIGIDGHILTGMFQGSRTWLLEILRRAPQLTPDIQYVVFSDDVAACRHLVSGPNILHCAFPVRSSSFRILAFWPYAILKYKLDRLVTQYIAPPLFASRQIVVVHDILFETHPSFFPAKTRWRNRALVRLSAKRARKVVTVSRYCQQQIAREYGLPVREIGVVHNGFACKSEAAALPLPLINENAYFLFVGRLEPRKNLRLALEAFARLGDPHVKLVVVGRNDFEAPDTLARLNGDVNVIHLQDVSDGELAALYAHARALIYPSLGEGWGIPVLEALGAGCPVIASCATAIPEAGGAACVYFDPLSTHAVDELAVLMARSLRGELSFDRTEAARHVASLSWDNAAKAFAEVVQGLAEARV